MELTQDQAVLISQAFKMAGFTNDPAYLVAERLIKQFGPNVATQMAHDFDHLVRKLNPLLPRESRIHQDKSLSHHIRSELRCSVEHFS